MNSFEQKLSDADLSLFGKIESQSTENDKKSLLACQFAVREIIGEYNYLEIGSYLGGSIQPHLLDERCKTIYSIDKRPEFQPDERGVEYQYQNNSTKRMLELLKAVSAENISKVKTIDGDTRELDKKLIGDKMHLCFIDGEHTDEAVFADFLFCFNSLQKNLRGGAIVFHDASIIYNGLADCLEYLKKRKEIFRAYNLPDVVFVIEIGNFPLHKNPRILDILTNGYEGYIFSLQLNDYYRQFANKKPFLLYRKLVSKLKGLNKFD